ncbi:RING-5 domain-containing protein [Mycena filopes]|nr:RING-5 domain-containing protein [Mycena filopes]
MSSDYEFSDEEADDVFDDDDMGMQDEDSDADSGMDILDDFKPTTTTTRKPYDLPYESLTQSAIESLMAADVDHIRGIFGVDASTASLLLRHLSWNKEKLIEKYMDGASAMLVAAGVTMPEPEPASTTSTRGAGASATRRPTRKTSAKQASPAPTSKKGDGPFVCPICFDDTPGVTAPALDCGHAACGACWGAYVRTKIRDEGESTCRCMAEGCALVAPDAFVKQVLLASSEDDSMGAEAGEGAATYARFQELLVRHFVACTSHLKFCPHPGCTNTVSCPGAAGRSVLTTIVPTVSCGARGVVSNISTSSTIAPSAPASVASGKKPISRNNSMSASQELTRGKEHKFCFGCPIDSDHRPVVCGVASLWLKKCRDDSETANWIKSNTKECAKCMSTIEKNGGCNHMTCKKCKHEFCWVCMGPWSEHGTAWYSCNRYEEKAGIDARDSQSKSRASLERYLHYYNRWANHEQSAKLALDLFAKTEKKMEEMQVTSALTWIEVQFMKKAVEEVDKCRMTLKWTYAMAYYLAKGNQKDLFEDNQRDLEKAVEDLSELLESPIEPENIPTLRQKVTDKTVGFFFCYCFIYTRRRHVCLPSSLSTGLRPEAQRDRAGGHRGRLPRRAVVVEREGRRLRCAGGGVVGCVRPRVEFDLGEIIHSFVLSVSVSFPSLPFCRSLALHVHINRIA